jgi:hypothetical protein
MVFGAGSAGLVAYDAGTGAQLWDNAAGAGRSVAVAPDGHAVFVIKPLRSGDGGDFLTSAFAATGDLVWARRYSGCAKVGCVDIPVALAVSPGGGRVFVTGSSKRKTSGRDYATVAYAAATGSRLWVSRYNGHGRSGDSPAAIAVSPRGGAVFVTGTSAYDFATVGPGRTGIYDFATLAYAAGHPVTFVKFVPTMRGNARGVNAARWPQPRRLRGRQPVRGGHLVHHRRSPGPQHPAELAEDGIQMLDVLQHVTAPDQVDAASRLPQLFGHPWSMRMRAATSRRNRRSAHQWPLRSPQRAVPKIEKVCVIPVGIINDRKRRW